MNKQTEKKLRQDLFKLQAEFLLKGDYLKIRENFVLLCELGLLEALELYYCVHDVGENKLIDRMVDGFPDCDEDGEYRENIGLTSIGNGFILNTPEMNDYFDNRTKAQIKFYRDRMEDMPREDYTSAFFEKMAEFPKSCGIENGDKNLEIKINNAVSSGSDWVIIFTSIQSILYNKRITPQIATLLMGVANQPHSDYLMRYKFKKTYGDIENDLQAKDEPQE